MHSKHCIQCIVIWFILELVLYLDRRMAEDPVANAAFIDFRGRIAETSICWSPLVLGLNLRQTMLWALLAGCDQVLASAKGGEWTMDILSAQNGASYFARDSNQACRMDWRYLRSPTGYRIEDSEKCRLTRMDRWWTQYYSGEQPCPWFKVSSLHLWMHWLGVAVRTI